MSDKSYVSMGQHVCVVCGVAFDTSAILLDRRLRATLEHYTRTGWGMCPEHKKMAQDGYIALVECNPERSGSPTASSLVRPEDVRRTGRLAHIRREVFARMFNLPIVPEQSCVFVEPSVMERLQAMAARQLN
ncbi:MAG: ATPase [Rudaea sp.]|uniref:ATPase n=1 Tax=Rudaea sp. TaxID=2136325 RepID=UPI0039E6C345